MIPATTGNVAARRLAALGMAALAACGCDAGDGLDRRAVSGEVSLGGRPLDAGSILFEPASEGVGTAAGAAIRDGRFAVRRDQGPVPGAYLVRIYASSGVQEAPRRGVSEHTPRPMVEKVPPAYNARTVLRADVSRDGPNTFRFDLLPDGP